MPVSPVVCNPLIPLIDEYQVCHTGLPPLIHNLFTVITCVVSPTSPHSCAALQRMHETGEDWKLHHVLAAWRRRGLVEPLQGGENDGDQYRFIPEKWRPARP